MHRSPLRVVVTWLAVLAAACGGQGAGGATAVGPAGRADPRPGGPVTVFAAASLTEAFAALGEAFSAANPGASVRFNFASSSALAAQIGQGAPADVFASADEAHMATVVEAVGTIGHPQVFATNRLQVIVAPGNPLGIDELQDLAHPDVVVVAAAPQVPIGRYTAQLLDHAGVSVPFRSYEETVKGVVTKVTLGEADAGVVYRTDVRAAGDRAAGVDIPAELDVVAPYPIAVPADAPNPQGGAAFVEFVGSPAGAAILEAHGFGPP